MTPSGGGRGGARARARGAPPRLGRAVLETPAPEWPARLVQYPPCELCALSAADFIIRSLWTHVSHLYLRLTSALIVYY